MSAKSAADWPARLLRLTGAEPSLLGRPFRRRRGGFSASRVARRRRTKAARRRVATVPMRRYHRHDRVARGRRGAPRARVITRADPEDVSRTIRGLGSSRGFGDMGCWSKNCHNEN